MKTPRPASRDPFCLSFVVLLGALAGPLLGQTYQQVAPQPVRPGPPPAPAQTAPPPALPPAHAADAHEVLVERLTGLRLVPSADRLSKTAVPEGQPLVIDGIPWLDQGRTEAVVKNYLSRPLTRGDLTHLVRDLVLLCRRSDRPVVDIYAPPQDVSTGVVQLIVLVARLGHVQVEGNQWFADKVLVRDVRVQPGQEIQGQQLLEDMDLINQNPFRQVDLVYARGAEAGQTDLLLRVHDQRPERYYVGYDDTGNEATGLGRVFAGLNLGNLWDADNQFSYQYTRSTDFKRLQAQSASYTIPLPWRHTFEVFGDWAEAKAESDAGLFDLDGTSWEVGVRYTIPLPMVGTDYTQSVNIGADYKWSNNDLDFGGTQVFTSPINVSQGELGYTGVLVDANGSTQIGINGFYSPGGIGGLNHTHDFIIQRAGSSATYEYAQANLTRVQKLPHDWTLVLTALGQVSSTRMVPANEFGLGGADSVRGYDERIVNGDDGLSGQLELRTPSRHLLFHIPDRTQALVFIDAGSDWENNLTATETNNSLAGIGPGIRMTLGSWGTVKCDYGWQLDRLPGTRSGRLHLSVILSY